jgi:hypothetical protein
MPRPVQLGNSGSKGLSEHWLILLTAKYFQYLSPKFIDEDFLENKTKVSSSQRQEAP